MAQTQSQSGGDDLTERTLGEFRLLRRLGRGGMAEVYLAEQTSLSRYVAVKILREDMLAGRDGVLLKRFRQEARAAGGLSHPHIVQIFMTGQEDGVHYIVQEYVPGRNLAEHVKRQGPPDAASALKLMAQMSDALQAASAAGIVHRDIKPENILLTAEGDAKIADFGLAQLAEVSDKLNLTQTGTTMGTPLYMSPEQVNGGKLDQRSDLYSLGVTCYHMLAGRPPFQGETAMGVALKHLRDDAAPLHERRPDLPSALCGIVHRMMSKEPDDRYQSAEELTSDLNSLSEALRTGDAGHLGALGKLGRPRPDQSAWLATITGRTPQRDVAVFVGACLLTGVAAVGIGRSMRPIDPLKTPPTQESLEFPREPTAVEQFATALVEADNEAAWQAVIQYFDGTLEARRAVAQLAYLYLRTDRMDDARKQFRRLVELGEQDADDSLRASGTAGLAVVATREGRFEDSRKILETQLVGDLAERLADDPTMQRLVDDAKRMNLEASRGDP